VSTTRSKYGKRVGFFPFGIEPHLRYGAGGGILIVASVVTAMTITIVAPAIVAIVAIVPAVGIIVALAIVAIMPSIWVVTAPVRIIAVSIIRWAVVVRCRMDVFSRGGDLRGKMVEIQGSRCLGLSEAADSKHYRGGAGYSFQDFHRLALAIFLLDVGISLVCPLGCSNLTR
jgi:hypothetical protein